MFIKRAKKKAYDLNDPLKLNCHAKPKTRREFIAQGFMTGGAAAFGTSLWLPNSASALSSDLTDLACTNIAAGSNKIPFICIDLAGGANIAGSNVLVGGRQGSEGNQKEFLSTAGYSKLGLPGDMIPTAPNADTASGDHINEDLGLAFHSDSPSYRVFWKEHHLLPRPKLMALSFPHVRKMTLETTLTTQLTASIKLVRRANYST